MYKQNLLDLIEFDEEKFQARVLVNQPGYRVVLLNLRSGQNMPQHSAKEMLMVYAMAGHITFYEGENPTDVRAGEAIWIGAGIPHWLAAHEDSSLLVVRAGDSALPVHEEELDLREVPRVQRHPLVFAKFDGLAVGESFALINDHDPVPLNRQMETMRPGQLAWEYMVRGPNIFRVRVRRIAPLTGSETSPVPGNTVMWIRPS